LGDQMTKKKMPATRSSVGGHVRAKGSQVDVEKSQGTLMTPTRTPIMAKPKYDDAGEHRATV